MHSMSNSNSPPVVGGFLSHSVNVWRKPGFNQKDGLGNQKLQPIHDANKKPSFLPTTVPSVEIPVRNVPAHINVIDGQEVVSSGIIVPFAEKTPSTQSTYARDLTHSVQSVSVRHHCQSPNLLGHMQFDDPQAVERIAKIDLAVAAFLKKREELASQVEGLDQLLNDASRSVVPVISSRDTEAAIRSSLAITESLQVQTPHSHHSGQSHANERAVDLRTTVIPSTEKPPGEEQPVAAGTSSNSEPSVPMQHVTPMSSATPPALKRKRSNIGQSETSRKTSNCKTRVKNTDGASEVAAKLSIFSTGNTTPPSHPPKKSSGATLPNAKKQTDQFNQTAQAGVSKSSSSLSEFKSSSTSNVKTTSKDGENRAAFLPSAASVVTKGSSTPGALTPASVVAIVQSNPPPPLSKGLDHLMTKAKADPRKNTSVPKLTLSRQSSSTNDWTVVNKSSVALCPPNDAAKTSLLSSGCDTRDHRQITLPLRSSSSLVSNPLSSILPLAEPSLSRQFYALQQLPAHSTSVRRLFINGPCLFSTSDDGIIHVYNLISGSLAYRVRGHRDSVTWLYSVSLNADTNTLKSLSENTEEYINQLHLITGSSDGFIRQLNLKTIDSDPRPNESNCGHPLTCVEGSKEQRCLYVGARNGEIFIYNPKTYQMTKAIFKSDSEIMCLKVIKFRSHKRAIIVAARHKDPVIFNLETGRLLFTLETNMPVGSSIFSITANSDSMVYCSDITNKIFTFNTDYDNALCQVDTIPSCAVNIYHTKKRYIIMGCMDGVVRVMDTLRKPHTIIKDLPGSHMNTLTAMNYTGDKVVCGGFSGQVSLRNVPKLGSLFD